MTLNIRKRMIKSRNQNKNRKKILYLWNENNKEKEDERKKEENNNDNTKKRVTYFFLKNNNNWIFEWMTHTHVQKTFQYEKQFQKYEMKEKQTEKYNKLVNQN